MKNSGLSTSSSHKLKLVKPPTIQTQSSVMVVLDPGHGGRDTGAVGNKITESRKTLQLATFAKFVTLQNSSVRCYLTRDTDWLPSFADRAKRATDLHADIVLSVHINASTSPDARGLWLFYGHGQVMSKAICQEIAAHHVPNHFRSSPVRIFDAYDDPVECGDEWLARPEHVLERYNCPSILIEYGFLSNEYEANYLRGVQAGSDFATLVLDTVTCFRRLREDF